jgi:hypothetical protein
LPDAWQPQLRANKRDIYYIVFDRYGSAEALQKYFGFNNSEFCQELEKRGFVVDRSAITSYPMTALAMTSTLNMRYLSSPVMDISTYFTLLELNDVAKALIDAGYQYHYFGNFYAPMRKSRLAKHNLPISLLPTEFADSLVNLTPFRPVIGRHYKYRFVTDKFAELTALAQDPAITFAYAHFLVPHPPYTFARDGSLVPEIQRLTKAETELYVDQLVATNRLILKMLDGILASSTIEPIIVLQADEGPYLMQGDESLSRHDQIAKRVGILNAIRIPDPDVRERLKLPLLPVNTFRFLFKEYLNAPLELLPNRVFYWEQAESHGLPVPGSAIVEVTQELDAGK